MFTGGKHKFTGDEHIFKGGEHKFMGRKHKKVRLESHTFIGNFKFFIEPLPLSLYAQ